MKLLIIRDKVKRNNFIIEKFSKLFPFVPDQTTIIRLMIFHKKYRIFLGLLLYLALNSIPDSYA
jgi:hypothetical protein